MATQVGQPVQNRDVEHRLSSAKILGVGIGLAALWFITGCFLELNTADEGYLWDGVLKTLDGEMPMRDFAAYDPARYWWCAAWMKIVGRGIFGLRFACAAAAAVGLSACVAAASRITSNRYAIGLLGIALLVCMLPRHKTFDITVLMVGILVGVRMIEQFDGARVFQAGLWVGIAGLVGRNHGLYQLCSMTVLFGVCIWHYYRIDRSFRFFRQGLLGLTVGATPSLGMLLLIPGYWQANVDWIHRMTSFGATNLVLPTPWPWRVWSENVTTSRIHWLSDLAIGSLFLLAPIVIVMTLAICVLSACLRLKSLSDRTPSGRSLSPQLILLLSAACVGAPYLHHAFARADIAHLAQGSLQSVVLILFALATMEVSFRGQRTAVAAFVIVAAGTCALATVRHNPQSSYVLDHIWHRNPWVTANITGTRICMPQGRRDQIDAYRKLVRTYVKEGQQFVTFGLEPGMYPVLRQRCPCLCSFPYLKEMERDQLRIIEQLQDRNVSLAVVMLVPIDGRADLLFSNTHPLVWDFLNDAFVQEPDSSIPGRAVYRRRDVLASRPTPIERQ